MLKKTIYFVSLAALFFLTFLIIEMLPIIFESSYQGILLLASVLILFLNLLYTYLTNKKNLKKSIVVNILLIISTTYLSIIFYNIYNYNRINYISYCKFNYLIVTFIFVIINVFLIIKFRKVSKKL